MKPENFLFWLNGFFELTNSNNLTEEQISLIKENLKSIINNVNNSNITNSLTIRGGQLNGWSVPCNSTSSTPFSHTPLTEQSIITSTNSPLPTGGGSIPYSLITR